jgi:putative membrane protein insertion efficiency factor
MTSNQLTTAVRWLVNAPAFVLVTLVRLYQWLISPLLGRRCRFYPSCSEYFIGAVRKYGAISGSLRGIWRICRCHPFHPGGYDPP